MRLSTGTEADTLRRPRAIHADAAAGDRCTETYWQLRSRMAVLRVAVDADRAGSADPESVRRGHLELDQCLRAALANALTAEAVAAPTPEGVRSWVGEGMARSLERELAVFAAIDLGISLPTQGTTS